MMEADEAFLHWLAGFIDGEGNFEISSGGGRATMYPYFRLTVRDDDAAIIREIQRRTRIGTVHSRRGKRGHEQNGVVWAVSNKRDTGILVLLLGAHPLRAKKARDFAVWTDAVRLASTSGRGDYRSPAGRARHALYRWRMAGLKAQLQETRIYRPPDVSTDPFLRTDPNTPLFDIGDLGGE